MDIRLRANLPEGTHAHAVQGARYCASRVRLLRVHAQRDDGRTMYVVRSATAGAAPWTAWCWCTRSTCSTPGAREKPDWSLFSQE